MANTDGTATANERDAAALKALIAALGGRDRKARQSSAHEAGRGGQMGTKKLGTK